MVHQVADADQRRHQSGGDDELVERPEHAPVRHVTREEIDGNDDAQYAAVAGQATLPDLEDLDRVGEVIRRVVEKTMPQSGADKRAGQGEVEERVEPFLIEAFASKHALDDLVTHGKTDEEHERVPADFLRTDGEDDWVGGPSNV